MLKIITCFELGIESKCLALYRSIERYVSHPDGVQVIGVSPRAGQAPSEAARAEATRLNVEYISEPLNIEFAFYPLANKPLSCARVAEIYPDGPYLFLDSDTLFLAPTDLEFLCHSAVCLRPVDTPNIGARTFTEPNGAYWRSLYLELGVHSPDMVVPGTTSQEIFAYYNSGFVFLKNGNIFRDWQLAFKTIMHRAIRPNQGLFFVEQSVLAAILSASRYDVTTPPPDINYPIHLHEQLKPDIMIESLRTIRHIHYHEIFKDRSQRMARLQTLGFASKAEEIVEFLDWPGS